MSNALTKSGLQTLLTKLQPQMKMALPDHVSPQMIHRVVLTEVSKNPAILKCSQESVLRSVMEACQLGLVPNATQGLAYLVPYKQTCQLIPGWKGLIKLALQSGKVSKIWARVVRERDEFGYEEGLYPTLTHKPCLDEDAGPIVGAYAVAKMVGEDEPQFEFMSKSRIDGIRSRSAAGRSGPWVSDYEEMAKKTVIRNLIKRLPTDSDRGQIAAEKAEGGMPGMQYDLEVDDFVYVEGDGEDDESAAARLNDKLEAPEAPEAPVTKPGKKGGKGKPGDALLEVQTPEGDAANLSGLELAQAQLRARTHPEDLRSFYQKNEAAWLKAFGPDGMAELDETYATMLEDTERPPEAA